MKKTAWYVQNLNSSLQPLKNILSLPLGMAEMLPRSMCISLRLISHFPALVEELSSELALEWKQKHGRLNYTYCTIYDSINEYEGGSLPPTEGLYLNHFIMTGLCRLISVTNKFQQSYTFSTIHFSQSDTPEDYTVCNFLTENRSSCIYSTYIMDEE